jgi:hypothetical protein
MTASVSDIIAVLPTLSTADREKLRTHLKLLDSLSTDRTGPVTNGASPDNDAQFVLEAVAATLASQGLEHTPPAMLMKSPAYPAFKEKLPGLMQYLAGAASTRTQQRALLELAVKLLYKNLNEMNLAISARTILSHIHRIPAVMNQHFPGYAQAGMLSWIVRSQR